MPKEKKPAVLAGFFVSDDSLRRNRYREFTPQKDIRYFRTPSVGEGRHISLRGHGTLRRSA